MNGAKELLQFALSLDESEKELLVEAIANSQHLTEPEQTNTSTGPSRSYIDTEKDQRRHARAFITAFNFPSSLDELRFEYLHEGAYLDIETLLYQRFRENLKVEWTVPKWAKPGDICMFYFVKTADEKLRCVQKELDVRRGELDWPTERGLGVLLRRGWHYYDEYAGTILALGRVASVPYRFENTSGLSHFRSPIYAEIDNITSLKNPLHISEFRDVIFITRGGTITPVFGHEFDIIRERIMRNNKVPSYFIGCSTKPIPLRNIDESNWMRIASEYRMSFILEQEFRGCYVDYLLQGISDNGIVYRECRTKKRSQGKSKKGFVDNVILFCGKYLPVEVKLNINTEHDLSAQCERYCHLGNLLLTEDVSVSRKKVHSDNVLIVDTAGLYMYSSRSKIINGILKLDDISQDSLKSIKKRIANSLDSAKNDREAQS